MNLRTAIRNWLLKPSGAELAGDPKAVALAGELVYGHVRRDLARMATWPEGVIVDDLTPEECAAMDREWEQRR